jgi:hypothetical protein
MRLAFSVLMAVLALLCAGRIGMAAPDRVSTLNSASAELRSARAKELATRDAQAVLTHRIAALKRSKSTDDALLASLLRESIEADKTLAAQIQDVRRAQQAVLQAVAQIDARIRELAPKLSEKNSIAVRKAAAEEITALRNARKSVAPLKAAEAHREWADHLVKIDPLDGPSELGDKNDALALTLRKIEQKKKEIAGLINEKKIAQAARDFGTDVTAMDEDLRTGRVSRKAGGENETLAVADRNSNPTAAPAAPAEQADSNAGGFQSPESLDDQDVGASAPPPTDPNRNDGLAGGNGPTLGAPQAKSTAAVTPQLPSGPAGAVSKQIDPNLLINLRTEQLDADSLDLSTLEKYMAELASMQQALAAQAQKIKARAAQLEKDEQRAKIK